MKAQLIKTRNRFPLSAASGRCAVGRRLPDQARPPGLQTTAPTHAVPITLPAPVASSSGMRSWETGICRAAKSISALPGRLTPLDAFPFPACRAAEPLGLGATSFTVSELWGRNPGVTKLTPGDGAATTTPFAACHSVFSQPHAKISPSFSQKPAPHGHRSWVSPLPGSKQAKAPFPEAGGLLLASSPPPAATTAPGVLEALASSNHGYARQQLDGVRVLHAEN